MIHRIYKIQKGKVSLFIRAAGCALFAESCKSCESCPRFVFHQYTLTELSA